MPRTHILQSWVGAAEYDEGDSYNGQQIGNRNQKSVGVHILRSGDQWKANISAYADEQPKKKPVKKKSAFEQITLADRHYQRLENLSIQLDEELESGQLSTEDWTYARKQLDVRLDKGWQRLCKLRGWNPAEKDKEIYSLCLEEMEEKHQQKRTQKPVDNQQEQGLSFSHELVNSLSEENCFKLPLKKLLTAKEKMVKILEILKS